MNLAKTNISTLIIYIGCFIGIVIILNSILFPGLFNGVNLLRLDALHYQYIVLNGYADYRVAFFPLFPKIWMMTGLGAVGISVLNCLIYFSCFLWLSKELNFNRFTFLVCLALPSAMFYYIPYSESFFFLGAVMVLLGMNKERLLLLCVGLFICSVARPAYTIFIPALLLVELLTSVNLKSAIKRFVLYALVVLAGTVVVGIIQFLDTGLWFKSFEAQAVWGNKLQLPTLPLRSWSQVVIIRYDGIALLCGLVSSFFLLMWIRQKYYLKKEVEVSKILIFSLAYIAGISFAVLLFRGGSLFSLNRFVFATPFAIVAFAAFLNLKDVFKPIHFVYVFISLNAYWLLFASYAHIQVFLAYLLPSLFLVAFIGMKSENIKFRRIMRILTLLIMFEFQIYLLIRYISGTWVA